MPETPTIQAAAMLYSSEMSNEGALPAFVAKLRQDGYAVGGILQETAFDDSGAKIGIDAVALDNDERFPIVRPTKEDRDAGACGLDRSVLTESSIALRRAMAKPVDLLVVEKFGEREQTGEGLADDLLAAMAEGIPVLVAVPAAAEEIWTDFTGGLGTLLTPDLTDLTRWWDSIRT